MSYAASSRRCHIVTKYPCFSVSLLQLFFLFAGAIITGAIFYEIERGTACFVGQECLWWHKNILTPWLEVGLPTGKRVLIQDQRPAIITDMIHSTWLSYTT